MARNDSSIPPTRWRNGLHIRPSAWSGADMPRASTVLRTLNQCGDIARDVFPPPWSLHLGLPDTLGDPEVRMLANGFELYYPEMANPTRVRCLMTRDGRWTGQANLELHPSLFSPELEVQEQDDTFLVDEDGHVSALSFRRDANQTRFCLCIDADSAEAAIQSAREGVPTDLDERWAREQGLRAPFWEGMAGLDIHAEVLSASVESLVYHLEPTEDGGLCSATALPALAGSSANTIFPLVQAWGAVDPKIATRLLENVLSRIQEDGIVPAGLTPEPTEPVEPAWPLLIQTCRLHRDLVPDSDLVIRSLPLLEKYLLSTIQFFDPTHRGLPTWPSAAASFIPDTYDEQVVSASLTALLLREIHAFLALTETHPVAEETAPVLESIRDRLLANLSTVLWDEENSACHDRYVDGAPIGRLTLSGLMPLGVERLPELIRTALLRKVKDPIFFGGGPGLASWQPWESDERPPPASSAHQLFALEALETAGATTHQLQNQCAESIIRWFDAYGALPIELRGGAIEATDPAAPAWYESSLMTACLVLRTLPAIYLRRAETQAPAYIVAMDRHRFTILFAFILLVVGIVATSILSDRRRPIESKVQEGSTQLLRNLMTRGDYATARDRLDDLKKDGDLPQGLIFIEGNLLFREKRFAEAIPLYQQCVEDEIATPKSDMNLALALYQSQRLEEAIAQYRKVIDEFGEENPGLQKLAETAILIIQTHGTTLLDDTEESPPAE